jgi:hypoxanthine phosphoribosyltransferase
MNSSSSAKRTRKLLISREQIAETIKRMANQIQEDYPADMPLLVGVLKGSFIFLADLVRQMQRPVEIDFIRLSSYGSDVKSSGSVRLRMGVSSLVKGKEILVVEDIVDTGLTTAMHQGI